MKIPGIAYGVLIALILIIVAVALRHQEKPERQVIVRTQATPYAQMSEFSQLDTDRTVMVHCGASMRVVMEQIAAEFQRRYDIGVQFNFGGSAELLSSIEIGRIGDIYVCHDPYAERIDEKGLLSEYVTAGGLEPVIMVPKNNPQEIEDLSSLRRPGLRIGMTDSRYSTAGRLVDEAIEERGWKEEIRNNIVIESRAHNELALALLSGHVDASVAWNFLPGLYQDEMDSIRPGVEFPDIRVTVCLLETSENVEDARKFMEFTTSEFGREALRYFGYLIYDEDDTE